MNIEFRGLEEVLATIDSIGDEAKAEKALAKACALVERAAKEKAPKGEGDLRRSITSKVENLVGEVYTPLEYAPYVEFGTGIYAEDGKGRQNVPWVYVEGSTRKSTSSKSYTLEEAQETVQYLREKGLEAYYTYGKEPHPYMRPALYENEEEIKRIIKEGLLSD